MKKQKQPEKLKRKEKPKKKEKPKRKEKLKKRASRKKLMQLPTLKKQKKTKRIMKKERNLPEKSLTISTDSAQALPLTGISKRLTKITSQVLYSDMLKNPLMNQLRRQFLTRPA